MGSSWSFEINIFGLAGALWSSDLANITKPSNTSLPVIPPDDCGPANLLSPGNAFWMVFVLAVACVVQLPGSLFLFDRSNFYRFSPELGVADALSVLVLLVKALLRGYQWRESLVAIFVVREGIGRGDLWWRKRIDTTRFELNSDNESVQENMGEDEETAEDRLYDYLEAKFHETFTLCQFSQIRLLGLGLAIVSFVKVLTILSTSASNPGVRATCILAIAYATSYFILELLTWTLVEFPGRRSLSEIPLENLLPVVRYVDPGNDPFTFPPRRRRIMTPEIPLNNLPAQEEIEVDNQKFPWNWGVMCTVGISGLTGPAVWMLLLSHIWNPLIGGIVLVVSIAGFIVLRLTGKLIHNRYFSDATTEVTVEAGVIEAQTNADRNPRFGKFRWGISVVKWIWQKLTTVNLLSTTWIILLSYYFGRVFQDTIADDPVAKPNWMDWLG